MAADPNGKRMCDQFELSMVRKLEFGAVGSQGLGEDRWYWEEMIGIQINEAADNLVQESEIIFDTTGFQRIDGKEFQPFGI